MKKQATDRKKSTKVNPRVFTVLLILGGILMVTGIALLAVEPIKTMNNTMPRLILYRI